jgi:hypothetical protein
MAITKTQPSAPNKRRQPRTSSAQPQQPNTSVMSELAQKRKDDMDGFLQLGVALCVFAKQYPDAGAIAMHGGQLTRALARRADQEEKLGKILDYLGVIGPYSEILAAALPLALQLAANHGRVPAEAVAQFGVVPPQMLETKVKLEIKQQQAKMLEELQAQEARVAEMQVETPSLFTPPNGKVQDTVGNPAN